MRAERVERAVHAREAAALGRAHEERHAVVHPPIVAPRPLPRPIGAHHDPGAVEEARPVQAVSQSLEDPIGQELTQLAKELQMGVGRKDAFRALAERTGATEIRSLAAHLIQSERFGTSISQTLRLHSESMRTHRRLHAEEMANKTQIKLLFPLIMFIFPSVMIVILMPAVMRLMDALKTLA